MYLWRTVLKICCVQNETWPAVAYPQEVIREALQRCGLEPGQVTNVQMHGTGTGLGDPIEVGAAVAVYHNVPAGAQRQQPLVATASKTWIGHTEAAAGAMGLLHSRQGLLHQATQALLHLHSVNPYLEAALAQRQSAGAWHLPRQTAGAPHREHLITGGALSLDYGYISLLAVSSNVMAM